MSLWKKTMDYLGLGPDDAYDDYDDYDEPAPAPRQGRAPRDTDPRGGWDGDAELEPTVRPVSARPSFPSRDFDASPTRRAAGNGGGRPDDSGVQVRPVPQQAPPSNLRNVSGGSMEPHTVRPRRFDQAQELSLIHI